MKTKHPLSQSYHTLLTQVPQPLLAWYKENRRILPWRENPKPYYVWISEIMLQQTRVEAVLPYFKRFTETLPDVPALAVADDELLHKLWEGLGYYSRVRNLKKAAIQMMERHNGSLPADYEALLALTGIGSYTAGAIGSIAFGLAVPAVDGNALRVFSRILSLEEDIKAPATKKLLEQLLMPILPDTASGDFNQAIMDIGSGICLGTGVPRCTLCPLSHLCTAYQSGCPTAYPIKSAKKKRSVEEKTVLLLCDSKGVVLEKRESKGLLAGLWQFPNLEGHLDRNEITNWLTEQGISYHSITPLSPAKHIFTHKEWWMIGYLIKCQCLPYAIPYTEIKENYTIPSAFGTYKQLLPFMQSDF